MPPEVTNVDGYTVPTSITVDAEPELVEYSATDGRHITVSAVINGASSLVILVCAYSIAIWLATGFVAINPFLAVAVAAAGVGFRLMGRRLDRENGGQDEPRGD